MNTWLSNFSEYKGLLNALCITCKWLAICKENQLLIEEGFCNGKDYVQEDPNETTKGT